MNFSSILLTKAHILCALVLLFGQVTAQRNLVPNPSFEILSRSCDSLYELTGGAKYWTNIIPGVPKVPNSYATFNKCATTICCKVPYLGNNTAYQEAHTGNGFVCFFFYYRIISTNKYLNTRDYIQTKLISKLKKETNYYVEFFVNNLDVWRYGVNNIGLHLSDTAITNTDRTVKPLTPQILAYGNPIIFDTLRWVKISGIYKANGNEQYLSIGNFKSDAYTDTSAIASGAYGAVYNIDDVSVIPLDSLVLKADAGRDTTIYKGDSAWIGSRISGITDMHWRTSAGGIVADSVPGLWVKPSITTTYILEQIIGGQYSKDTVKVTVVQPVPVLVVNGQLLVVKEGKAVEFSWQTANEVNLSHFVVEQSPDGLQYQAAGTVKANGGYRYRFEIPTASISQSPPFRGWGYFRLKMEDKDGKVAYSKVYTISLTTNPLSLITIIPNPAKDQITITGKNLPVTTLPSAL